MSEPTDWIGGQLTSQAVPPDEHPWIERLGCTASYRALRDGIRAHYRAHFPLTAAARAQPQLNPGACFVSRLGHEPRVAVAVLEAMLPRVGRAAARARARRGRDGRRPRRRRSRCAARAATWSSPPTGSSRRARPGDLLPLAGVEHVTGFESQAMTGEPHAPAEHQPDNLQPVTVCFAVDHLAGEDHTIPRPARYDEFAEHFTWVAPDPRTNRPVARRLDPNPDEDPLGDRPRLRRPRPRQGPLALPAHRRPRALRAGRLPLRHHARQLAAGRLPRGARARRPRGGRARAEPVVPALDADRGAASPGLRLRGDVVGDTPDGLAKHAYIREPRRLQALTTVREQDIAGERGRGASPTASASAPTGSTCIPSTGGDPYLDLACAPVPDPARRSHPAARRQRHRRGQGDRHHAHHQRRLPPAPGRVERRRGGRPPRRPTAPRAARSRAPSMRARRPHAQLQRELVAARRRARAGRRAPPRRQLTLTRSDCCPAGRAPSSTFERR